MEKWAKLSTKHWIWRKIWKWYFLDSPFAPDTSFTDILQLGLLLAGFLLSCEIGKGKNSLPWRFRSSVDVFIIVFKNSFPCFIFIEPEIRFSLALDIYCQKWRTRLLHIFMYINIFPWEDACCWTSAYLVLEPKSRKSTRTEINRISVVFQRNFPGIHPSEIKYS